MVPNFYFDQDLGPDDITKAKNCLKYFSFRFGEIYGIHHLVYNVHSLIHLADECEIHGRLDEFSCFPFETYLGKLKKLVRSSNKPLAQLVRRISELEHVESFNMEIMPSIFNQRDPTASLMNSLKPRTRSDSYYLTSNGKAVKVLTILQYITWHKI